VRQQKVPIIKPKVKCIEKINPISSAILILDFDDPKHINFINLLEARLTKNGASKHASNNCNVKANMQEFN